MEIEVSKHAELEGCINSPIRIRLRDRDSVDVMEHEFHSKETYQETNSVQNCSVCCDTFRDVAVLRYIVVKGNNGASQIKW